MLIHLGKEAKIALLIAEKVKTLTNYLDFSDIFSKAKVLVLSEITELNQHAIELQEDQKSLYRPIYSLGPVELEMLKIYIKINLANGFIWPSKSPADAPILFVRKPDGSFYLYINYQGFNNLTIKN